jgi:hypothetical protein
MGATLETNELYDILGISRTASDTEVVSVPCFRCCVHGADNCAESLLPVLQALHCLLPLNVNHPRAPTTLQVRRAYRNLITKAHPDKGGDVERFRQIQQAFEVLSDAAKVRHALIYTPWCQGRGAPRPRRHLHLYASGG